MGLRFSDKTIECLAKDIAMSGFDTDNASVSKGGESQYGHLLFVWIGKNAPAEAQAAVLEIIKNTIAPEVKD